jgi:hypothetical protein
MILKCVSVSDFSARRQADDHDRAQHERHFDPHQLAGAAARLDPRRVPRLQGGLSAARQIRAALEGNKYQGPKC